MNSGGRFAEYWGGGGGGGFQYVCQRGFGVRLKVITINSGCLKYFISIRQHKTDCIKCV